MGNCFRRLRSSIVRRATESQVSEKKVEAEQGSQESSQVSKNAQNDHELQSFDDKGGSPIDKVQPLGKEQSPTDIPDSQDNMQMKVLQNTGSTPTGYGNREYLSPRNLWKTFQEEFKKKAELARPKITSKMEFDCPTLLKEPNEPRSIHALFTHKQNGSKVAAIVDLRNRDKIADTLLLERLRSLRKAVLGNAYGCDRVYTYLYVKEGAKVSGGVKIQAEKEGIKIVRRDELSPDELIMEIDEKLQSACRSKIEPTIDIRGAGPTDAQNSDYTDHAPVTDHRMRLSDGDHAKICNELEDYAAKWREIGGALGFSEGELNNIQANQMLLTQFPPMSYLKEMVSQWLQWASGDGRGSTDCATKESLVAALLKVNLGQLAEKIDLQLQRSR